MFGPKTPDIILQDRDDQPIGVVEVKSRTDSRSAGQEQLSALVNQLGTVYPTLSFGLLVDPEEIDVFRREAGDVGIVPVAQLKTRETLGHYAPEFAGTDTRYAGFRFFEDLMVTLVTSWLRGLAYRWKSEHPPGIEELASTGLLEKLEGGFAGRKLRAELADAPGI
jgi:hypothetical protein